VSNRPKNPSEHVSPGCFFDVGVGVAGILVGVRDGFGVEVTAVRGVGVFEGVDVIYTGASLQITPENVVL
jgi:hypothetical protein